MTTGQPLPPDLVGGAGDGIAQALSEPTTADLDALIAQAEGFAVPLPAQYVTLSIDGASGIALTVSPLALLGIAVAVAVIGAFHLIQSRASSPEAHARRAYTEQVYAARIRERREAREAREADQRAAAAASTAPADSGDVTA
ncbi:Uncharacterised protein [Mycobacteroides abscessus]|uniref:hypothetical protein n=1 Tax=Mycobacteroides abscessus TaxID=36809 RepID=UPI0005DA7CC9|nr:hypothetical protein [Mycobacteroides abscessus]CPX20625.1 Uncharacterised protein [Mycobacteroides abscessus]CRG61229.1 Uncharacterised protein [Mycobacteroides abscessus]